MEEITRKYVKRCAQTYLEGGQSLPWAVGTITRSGLDPQQIRAILSELRGYGSLGAWQQLMEAVYADLP